MLPVYQPLAVSQTTTASNCKHPASGERYKGPIDRKKTSKCLELPEQWQFHSLSLERFNREHKGRKKIWTLYNILFQFDIAQIIFNVAF